jgi:hypothetical protein
MKVKLEIGKTGDKFVVKDENGIEYGPAVSTRKEAEELLKDWRAYYAE